MAPIWKLIFCLFGFIALAGVQNFPSAYAQSNSAGNKGSKAIDISSDSMELYKEENRAVFIGKVDALRDGVILRSDKLVADYVEVQQSDGSNKTEVRFLNATGNVLVITDKQRITSEWATMDVQKDTAVMGGNVVVKEGNTIIRGPKLFLDLETGKSNMRGGRVKGRFFPQE